MACTRFSPDGVSRYSVILRPPKLIRGRASRRTTSPLGAWNSEPTEMPSASHSRISEATETLARSRSSLDTKPLVRPACSATSAMLIRAASLAAFNRAPMRVPSGTASGTPFPLLALDTGPTSDETLGCFYETKVDYQETFGQYSS